MKKFIAIGLIGVATCSAMAAFVRQATEEYPGGGGGGGDVTKAYVDAADLAVTNYVKASFLALGGSPVSGPVKGRIDFKDGTTNKGSIGWHTGAFSVSAYGAALDFYANLGTASEKKSSLTPDGTAVMTYTSTETAFVKKLTGKEYDFENGANFSQHLYTTLTNVIYEMGGTVKNPPAFN